MYSVTILDFDGGFKVFSTRVHALLEFLRIGRMKYRLSLAACPDVVQRVKAVEYPLVCVK